MAFCVWLLSPSIVFSRFIPIFVVEHCSFAWVYLESFEGRVPLDKRSLPGRGEPVCADIPEIRCQWLFELLTSLLAVEPGKFLCFASGSPRLSVQSRGRSQLCLALELAYRFFGRLDRGVWTETCNKKSKQLPYIAFVPGALC